MQEQEMVFEVHGTVVILSQYNLKIAWPANFCKIYITTRQVWPPCMTKLQEALIHFRKGLVV